MKKTYLFLLGVLALLAACQNEPTEAKLTVNTELYDKIQEQLITAQAGAVIEIPAGTYLFDRPLSLDGIAGVTIKGAGKDKTILSFKGQKAGAEGLKITADSVTIEGLTVQDTKGDAIKLQDCKGIVLRDVKTTWTGGALATNGGYGLYPVASENVLIENCEASYASDAGIYVGQSKNVVIKNSYAHHNVAGIEIENCVHSLVINNVAEENSGGILVFDLPDLPAGNGHSCIVKENKILNNNFKNFSPEGNMVAIVPPGTGVILLAAKGVDVFNNEIKGHKTIGVAIASFHITQRKWEDKDYDPFTYDIFVHDNLYERKGGVTLPDLTKDFGKMVNLVFKGKQQDILYDGIVDEKRTGANPMNICIQEKSDDLRFGNVDAAHDFKDVITDISVYNCQGKPLNF